MPGKWQKMPGKWQEMPGKWQKIIFHPIYDNYELHFWHVYAFHIRAFVILYKYDLKCKQR